MRRPPSILIAIVAVFAGFLVLGAIVGGGWGPRHDQGSNVTIVNPGTSDGSGSANGMTVDGRSVQPGSVIVIDGGRRGPGFFPFFPIFPLFFLGFVMLGIIFFSRCFRRGFGPGGRRGPGGYPGRGPAGPPDAPAGPAAPFVRWWEQEDEPTPSDPPASAPQAPRPDREAPAPPTA